jgi:SAM-dependent methyltransferase
VPDQAAAQIANNAAFWRRDKYLQDYRNRILNPAEVLILVRYSGRFAGHVLEIGCGVGRLLSYLVELAEQAYEIDVFSGMVDCCRAAYPTADVRIGDLRALAESLDAKFDVLFAADNVLDVLDDEERRRVLTEIREHHLASGGLLVFSSHNLAHMNPTPGAKPAPSSTSRLLSLSRTLFDRSPIAIAGRVARLPRRRADRKRLGPLQHRAADHAVINDPAHDHGLLHYYISRDDQERQLGGSACSCWSVWSSTGRPSQAAGMGPAPRFVTSGPWPKSPD